MCHALCRQVPQKFGEAGSALPGAECCHDAVGEHPGQVSGGVRWVNKFRRTWFRWAAGAERLKAWDGVCATDRAASELGKTGIFVATLPRYAQPCALKGGPGRGPEPAYPAHEIKLPLQLNQELWCPTMLDVCSLLLKRSWTRHTTACPRPKHS